MTRTEKKQLKAELVNFLCLSAFAVVVAIAGNCKRE